MKRIRVGTIAFLEGDCAMQGRQAFDPQAKATIDLESFVVPDHFLRRVDRVLDLTFVHDLTAARYVTGKGRPSIDPEVFFRIQLVAYFYGIRSERRLCQELRDNLAYRWFCRLPLHEDVPDHSSLTRIRDRLGEEIFAQVFQRIVEQCKRKKLVHQDCRVMTDATLIEADAALDSLVHNDPEIARQEADALRGRTKSMERPARRKLSNSTHTSRTDPDATLAQKRGTPRQLKYKVHQSIDGDSRVVLDTHVTTGGRHDNQPFLEQLQRIADQHGIRVVEAIADRGYGSAAIIRKLREHGTKTSIPLWSGRVGKSKHLESGLVYEKQRDRFRCPAGKYLYPSPTLYENYKRYVSQPNDCRQCDQSTSCTAKRKQRSSHQRFVLRSLDQDLFEEVQAQMRDPTFGEIMSERMWKIEGLFAEAKRNHNLSRAKYRGRAKVQIQAYLSAMAQNLKRLVAPVCQWLRCLSLTVHCFNVSRLRLQF